MSSTALSVGTGGAVQAAEQIHISYGLLERSIPVASLETFAETGHVDSELQFYARRVSSQRLRQVRQILQTDIPLDEVSVSQFLYSPIGESLLNRLDAVIQTEARQSGFHALRAALILAASDPAGFTPLTILQRFPTEGIRINVAEGLAIADALQTLLSQTRTAVEQVQQQASLAARTAPLPPSLPAIDLQASGALAWEQRSLTVDDPARGRTFPVDLYVPTAAASSPVIVISHGLGSERSSFDYLARHLASHGFAVAIPAHPGSNTAQLRALLQGRAERVTPPQEFIDRPLDVSRTLDALDRLTQSDERLRGKLNLEAVGVLGQSYGGYTALSLAGATLNWARLQRDCDGLETSLNLSLTLQCLALQLAPSAHELADARIRAAIAINPVNSSILGPAGLRQIDRPTLIVAGSADTVAPALPEQIRPFAWLSSADKYLALIEGGTHFSIPVPGDAAAFSLPTAVLGPEPALAQRYMRTLSVAFFQTHVAQQPDYQPFLSAAYADQISQAPLQLSLVRSLPAALQPEPSPAPGAQPSPNQ